jgi:predicted transcriptional regulator
MGVAKTDAFNTRHNELAAFAKALSHPARVAIIEYLIKADQCICGDLVEELPLAQATVSQHLVELKKAGLIRGTVTGTSVCYCLDKTRWATCIAAVSGLISSIRKATGCC